MKRALLILPLLVQAVVSSPLNAGDPQPKYGPKGTPKAIPLALSNEYFRDPKHPAPAFWALISNYIPQTTGASCATATLAMTLNAARAHLEKTASDAVITENTLWENVNADLWKEQPNERHYKGEGHGIALDQLGRIAEAAFKKYGFPKVKLKVVHVQDKSSLTTPTGTRAEIITDLKSLSDKTFIMANFNQKSFTHDAEVGHFAPVGAFDEKRGRVLILDPDRGSGALNGYYEPYWVSIESFMDGMNTLDSSNKRYRGYILVQL